jgi:hypothetical protein
MISGLIFCPKTTIHPPTQIPESNGAIQGIAIGPKSCVSGPLAEFAVGLLTGRTQS